MDDKNKIDYVCKAASAQRDDTQLMRHVYGGTKTMRAQREAYLPKHPKEKDFDYMNRLARSIAFPALKRTVKGLVGMVFRRDPEIEAGGTLTEHLEDIDLHGSHLDTFARSVFDEALQVGHCGVLVDAPAVAPAPNAAAEKASGVRPYWVKVVKESIINWRHIRGVDGRPRLGLLVLKGTATEEDGEYGEQEMVTYTEYRLMSNKTEAWVAWSKWQQTKDEAGAVALTPAGTGTIANVDDIPFVVVYSDKVTELVSIPPLRDLAYTQIAHYQLRSDQFTSLHKAGVPILTITGVSKKDEVIVGPNTGLNLPQGADAKYVEHSGSALGENRNERQQLITEMATEGLSMLQHESRAAETAEAKRIDKAEQDSALAVAARSLQDGLESLLGFHLGMLKQDGEATVVVNRDFERMSLDAAEIAAYSDLVASGQLSLDTLWAILSEGGSLPDEFEADKERALIDADLSLHVVRDGDDDEDEDE